MRAIFAGLDNLNTELRIVFLKTLGQAQSNVTATDYNDVIRLLLFLSKGRQHTLKVIFLRNEIDLILQ